ncbi:MAG: ABC transporter ATP-binding protein [Desulfurococcales archaeon]|nr:ABC transporter ATP-binding protein [Desulfurococcales archaeon]
MECRLSLRDVTVKTSRDKEIIKGITLQLIKGIHAIAGPNGAGKTTLLKAIAGVQNHSGTIEYCGERTSEISSKISYTPATPVIDPLATVYDVLRAGLFNSRGGLDHAMKYLKLLQINHLLHRRFTSLSSGEQRLVCLTRALARAPSLLLLDEPLSFLDVRNQVAVIKLLRRYSMETGAIVLLTTHEIHYLWAFDTVTIISKGSLAYHGDPSSLSKDLLERVYGIELMRMPVKGELSSFIPDLRSLN